jgi:hypothetical protein
MHFFDPTSKPTMPDTTFTQQHTTTIKTQKTSKLFTITMTILAIIAIALALLTLYLPNRKIANQIFDKQNIKNNATKLKNTSISI